jgi:hypothetical protein
MLPEPDRRDRQDAEERARRRIQYRFMLREGTVFVA